MNDLSTEVSLRSVVAGDEAFLRTVYCDTREHERQYVDWPDGQFEAFVNQQFDAQHRQYLESYPGARFQVIEYEHIGAIGRLYVQEREDEYRVIDITLRKEWQRKGIGGYLMQQILDEAAETSRRVSIHVEARNPAIGLYERLGFKFVEDEGIYWLMEWQPPS